MADVGQGGTLWLEPTREAASLIVVCATSRRRRDAGLGLRDVFSGRQRRRQAPEAALRQHRPGGL